ncbi:hypothetical protein HMPREF9138_01082 [Prevotella histicola F0411]|uniref:Uncharacterized protein n=1 Tax=Prevotella histicola F0411 TaxID=857291 RepID=G6AG55_9BACT|nr:hypothetical protein HMPREF9138_01082 [Prevotella histicola F0411]
MKVHTLFKYNVSSMDSRYIKDLVIPYRMLSY